MSKPGEREESIESIGTLRVGPLAPISERTVERTQIGTPLDYFYKIQGPLGSHWGGLDNDCALFKFKGKTIGTVMFHFDGRRKHDKCHWNFWECWDKKWPFNIEDGYCNSIEEGMKIIEDLFLNRFGGAN